MVKECSRPGKFISKRKRDGAGFTLIELLIGMTILAFGLLSIAAMFDFGYRDVAAGGKTTMALEAARQILEDARTLPFANVQNLNGFDTNLPATLPAADPERAVARKWQYVLAGSQTGWPAPDAAWNAFASQTQQVSPFARTTPAPAGALNARGQIAVVDVTPVAPGPTLWQVTVTLTIPGRSGPSVQIATLISR